MKTQKDFNVTRYLGKWYDVAHKEFKWQKGCAFSSAEYSWDSIKKLMVVKNNCLNPNREIIYSRSGEARIPNMNDKSKLKIKFTDGLPSDPEGDYFVHWTDYDNYSIVGGGGFLWILSRSPQIPRRRSNVVRKSIFFRIQS